MGGVGGPSHYVVTPTRDEVELRLSWAVTIERINVRFQAHNDPGPITIHYGANNCG